MLPLAWFYISLVVSLYALLFFVEMRTRARRHVKGCPSLLYVSPARLDSLIAIEPDLFVVELGSCAVSGEQPRIPGALRMPVSQLESFLQNTSPRSVFVFYHSAQETVTWARVECLVNNHAMRNVFVLKGGSESWLRQHPVDGVAVAG